MSQNPLSALRSRFPSLQGMSDEDALDAVHSAFYSDMDKADLAGRLGMKLAPPPPPPAPEGPGFLRGAADTGLALGKGAVTGVKMISDAFGAENTVSQGLGKGRDWLASMESEYSKWEQQQSAAEMEAAKGTGIWNEVGAAVNSFKRRPLDMIVEAAGTSLPTLAAALLPGGQGAVAIRIGAMLGMGGVQGAGSVKGQIHQEVEQAWLKSGAAPEQARLRADEAQEYLGTNQGQIALGTALGAAAGVIGAEGSILAKRILAKAGSEAAETVAKQPTSLMGKALGYGKEGLKEGVPEAFQGGQEAFAGGSAVRNEGFEVNPWDGVAGSAALEGLAGFGMGAAANAVPSAKPDPLQKIADAKTGSEVIEAFNEGTADLMKPGGASSVVSQAAQLAGFTSPTDPLTEPTATVVDAPFADRVLNLRTQLANDTDRQLLREKVGDQALNEATYYMGLADDASNGLPDKTRENMLAMAEAILDRGRLRDASRQEAGDPLAPRAGEPERIGGESLLRIGMDEGPARIGLDDTPTDTMVVDAQGNASPRTRAEEISLMQRARERESLGQQAPTRQPGAALRPDGPPAIGYDTTPTGAMRVDGQGNVLPETRADQINTRQALAERESLGQQTPRGGAPAPAPAPAPRSLLQIAQDKTTTDRMVVDAAGNARPELRTEQVARENETAAQARARQLAADMGLTPDVIRAQQLRQGGKPDAGGDEAQPGGVGGNGGPGPGTPPGSGGVVSNGRAVPPVPANRADRGDGAGQGEAGAAGALEEQGADVERNAFGLPMGYAPTGAQRKKAASELTAGDWINDGGRMVRVLGVTAGPDGKVNIDADTGLARTTLEVSSDQVVTVRAAEWRGRGAEPAGVPSGPAASWVIREKATGQVILETFDKKKVDALNTQRYEAVPIREHLAGLSQKPEASSGAQDQAGATPAEGTGTSRPTPAQAAPNEYPSKSDAIRAGEQSGGGYTVEPVGERDPAKPWRLVLDQPASNKFTYSVSPGNGGFIISSADGGGVVLAGRPTAPGILDRTPARVFKSESDARAFMAKKGMREAQAATTTEAATTEAATTGAPAAPKVFQTKSAATVEARKTGGQVEKVEGGYEVKPKQPRPTKANPNKTLNPDDTLLEAVAKLGGISRESAGRFGLVKEELRHQVRVGNGMKAWVFRVNGGRTVDDMREVLAEAGYFDGVPADEQMSALEDAIKAEIGGSPRYSTEGMMRREEQRAREESEDARAETERMLAEEDAAERAAIMAENGQSEAMQAALADDDLDALPTQSGADAMRALGFTEDEINEAESQGAREPREGSAAQEVDSESDEAEAARPRSLPATDELGESQAGSRPQRLSDGAADDAELNTTGANLPEGVRDGVRNSLGRLMDWVNAARPNGPVGRRRILGDRLAQVVASLNRLATFREAAAKKGYDAERVIDRLGPEPLLRDLLPQADRQDTKLANDERLVLLCCGETKLDRSAPARELYTGPTWQTFRTHAPAGLANVAVVSAEYGLVHGDEQLDTYEQPMTLRRQSVVRANLERQVEALAKRLGKPVREVIIVGGSDYRQAQVEAVLRLMQAGKVAPDANIIQVDGQIGEQRQQLGELLRGMPGERGAAKPAPSASLDGAKVERTESVSERNERRGNELRQRVADFDEDGNFPDSRKAMQEALDEFNDRRIGVEVFEERVNRIEQSTREPLKTGQWEKVAGAFVYSWERMRYGRIEEREGNSLMKWRTSDGETFAGLRQAKEHELATKVKAGLERDGFLPRAEQAEPELLTSQTEADLAEQAKRQEAADKAERAEQKRLADRDKANAELGEFTLTGSDSPRDVGAAVGQGDMFDAPAEEFGGTTAELTAKPTANASETATAKPTANTAKPTADIDPEQYAQLEGATVEQEVTVEETGQTVKLRLDAASALRQLDERRKTLEGLKACIGGRP